jgi:cytochrome o ubiquinol oxidase subunit 2
MLNPKGIITFEERRLFYNTLALMLFVVLPVIVMSFAFVVHYQAKNRLKSYKPNWSHDVFLECLWWGIPLGIIIVLAILTWKKTHELDPFRPISNTNKEKMIIQVIALPWKWLFIYPQQNIATVNYLVMPVDQPVEYVMTADNVAMSAFFIPQIGSQIYVMPGMRSKLNLIANKPGIYEGLNTQFNGDGFSEMNFKTYVVPADKMQDWIKQIAKSSEHLTNDAYIKLLYPSINDKPHYFSEISPDLFNNVVNLYMNSTGSVHPRANQANFK